METDLDFSQYNENFDHEVTDPLDWLDLHINTLFSELQQIHASIHIFKVVDSEWGRRVAEKNVPDYFEVRTILYESLVYRTVLGLSKIFSNSKEYSLLKATNQIEQMQLNSEEVRMVIKEIRERLSTSQMIEIIHTYRDKFFAHLDKKSVLSYCRIDPTSVMAHIDNHEIEEWLELISNFYEARFGKKLSRQYPLPSEEDIIYTFFWR